VLRAALALGRLPGGMRSADLSGLMVVYRLNTQGCARLRLAAPWAFIWPDLQASNPIERSGPGARCMSVAALVAPASNAHAVAPIKKSRVMCGLLLVFSAMRLAEPSALV
jgi:hypothetical protein